MNERLTSQALDSCSDLGALRKISQWMEWIKSSN